MSQYEKFLLSILSGTQDRNMLFADLRLSWIVSASNAA